MSKKISRRDFISKGALSLGGLAVLPATAMAEPKAKAAPAPKADMKKKIRIAGVGVGGRGAGVLKGMETEDIVALCDVDFKYAAKTFERYPQAKQYKDYRQMFAEMGDKIDAVMIATADHTHALIAAEAIQRGIHVYCEKPLTHSIYESRLLTKLAAKHKVVTQMGNQGSSLEGVRRLCDWIWNGEIGEITKVECFTDRPIWPQGLEVPEQVDELPDTLDWDLFIGPAPMRPYNKIYTPWNWRGWWDFGTGALGDMACHIMHPAFKALKLGYPTAVQGSSTSLLTDCAPSAQRVHMQFPARKNMDLLALPAVELIWYDGGLRPDRPKGMPEGKDLNVNGGCTIFHGTKDTLICGCYGVSPYLLSGREPKVPSVHPVCELSHEQDFIRAVKQSKAKVKNIAKTASDFSEAGVFNEIVCIGVAAVRLQALNRVLEWDGENMKFTNIEPSETLRIMKKDGFSIKDGHPTFNKEYTEPVNALEFANSLVKHSYRAGWELPEMP